MKLSLFAYKSQKRPIDRLDGPSDKNRPTDSWMGIHARTFISVRVLEWKERKKEAGKRKLKEERKEHRHRRNGRNEGKKEKGIKEGREGGSKKERREGQEGGRMEAYKQTPKLKI
jgi:flagellar biosynthesis/type III secretory pathway protein FliH